MNLFSGFNSGWNGSGSTSEKFHWYSPSYNSSNMLDDPKRPPPSNSPHHGAKLTSYKGDPFVAGGLWHRKTEKLSWTDSNGEKDVEKISGWEYVDDFPSNVRGSIYRYAAVSTGDAVYLTACCIKPSYIPPGKSDSFQAGSIEHETVSVRRTANKAEHFN